MNYSIPNWVPLPVAEAFERDHKSKSEKDIEIAYRLVSHSDMQAFYSDPWFDLWKVAHTPWSLWFMFASDDATFDHATRRSAAQRQTELLGRAAALLFELAGLCNEYEETREEYPELSPPLPWRSDLIEGLSDRLYLDIGHELGWRSPEGPTAFPVERPTKSTKQPLMRPDWQAIYSSQKPVDANHYQRTFDGHMYSYRKEFPRSRPELDATGKVTWSKPLERWWELPLRLLTIQCAVALDLPFYRDSLNDRLRKSRDAWRKIYPENPD